jgi:hypothetical protein
MRAVYTNTMKHHVFTTYSHAQQKEQLQKFIKPVDARRAQHTCGDGRKCIAVMQNGEDIYDSQLATQNFGGTLGLAASYQLYCYIQGKPVSFNDAIEHTCIALTQQGFNIGDHRSETASGNTSGCGYADNRAKIIACAAAVDNLPARIQQFMGEESVPHDSTKLLQTIAAAYKQLHADIESNTQTIATGSELVEQLEDHGGTTQILEGEHEEYAVIINRQNDTTLHTNALVHEGGSAFSVDEYHVLNMQDSVLKIPREIAKLINYVEWYSTLHTLSGTPTNVALPLPVFIYE